MKWSQIAQIYLNGCNQAEGAATNELLLHLNEGYRSICARTDFRELEATDESVVTEDGSDWARLPENVFHVIQVDDITNGVRMSPEPANMRGRSRYLATDSGMPDDGQPQFYALSADRLYLRPTPDGEYRLRIRYKIAPPEIGEEDFDAQPLLPEHMHMAIAWAASASFYTAHPEMNSGSAETGRTLSDNLLVSIEKKIADAQNPKQRERFDQDGRARIPGFSRFTTGWG